MRTLLLTLSLAAAAACAPDLMPGPVDESGGDRVEDDLFAEPVSTTAMADGSRLTRVNSSDGNRWVYFSFETGAEVAVDDALTSDTWDLAFQRFYIRLNGGVSGPGNSALAALDGIEFGAAESAPAVAEEYLTDEEDGDDPNEWPDLAFLTAGERGWFTYNPQNHALTPTEQLFALRSSSGDYYQIIVDGYYDDRGRAGRIQLRWIELAAPEPSEGDE